MFVIEWDGVVSPRRLRPESPVTIQILNLLVWAVLLSAPRNIVVGLPFWGKDCKRSGHFLPGEMVYMIPSFSRIVSLTKIVCDPCPLFSSNSVFAFSTKAGDHQSHRATDWSYQQWGLRSLHVSRDGHICFASTHWPSAFFLPLYLSGYLKSCLFKPRFNMLTRAFCRINDKGHSRKKQLVYNFREMTQLLI